jgi:hypothetical protein
MLESLGNIPELIYPRKIFTAGVHVSTPVKIELAISFSWLKIPALIVELLMSMASNKIHTSRWFDLGNN